MPKTYIAGEFSRSQMSTMFINNGWEVVDRLENADLVQFTGGADVNPKLYGEEEIHPFTNFSEKRDAYETLIFLEAAAQKTPMAGICRGGQFLNVMCGGRLAQHITKHSSGEHLATDLTKQKQLVVSSTHHQMMLPGTGANVKMVANLNSIVEDGSQRQLNTYTREFEALLYKEKLCFCFQPHPEYYDKQHDCQTYYFTELEKLLELANAPKSA
jgi:gamma-glutamyl-gamma-aminobutyrate hydrolase PuuD